MVRADGDTTSRTIPPGAHGDRILILVGVTADRRKRNAVRMRLAALTGFTVTAPWLPYAFGLTACALWLRWRWRALTGPAGRVHLLLYIGGAAILSLAAPRLDLSRLSRVVIDRGPIQELVPVVAAQRMPPILRILPGGVAVADLARVLPTLRLPPIGTEGTGLIVEHGISALARRLELTTAAVPAAAWSQENLAPDATEVLQLDLSHDEVYDDDRFLRPAARFLATGAFSAPGPGAGERKHHG